MWQWEFLPYCWAGSTASHFHELWCEERSTYQGNTSSGIMDGSIFRGVLDGIEYGMSKLVYADFYESDTGNIEDSSGHCQDVCGVLFASAF